MQDFLVAFSAPFDESFRTIKEAGTTSAGNIIVAAGLFHSLAKKAKSKEEVMEWLKMTRQMLSRPKKTAEGGDSFLHGDY